MSKTERAQEMGADAVLVKTDMAVARDPSKMAQAFQKAVEARCEAYGIDLPAAAPKRKRRAR